VCGYCSVVCGDGSCDVGEDFNNCCQDCGWCGDGVCRGAAGEDAGSCASDCGGGCTDAYESNDTPGTAFDISTDEQVWLSNIGDLGNADGNAGDDDYYYIKA